MSIEGAPSAVEGGGRTAVVLYTDSFKIDGFVDPPAGPALILDAAGKTLVVHECKVYDRLQRDKFVFTMSRMEVRAAAVELVLPRDAVTKEGTF